MQSDIIWHEEEWQLDKLTAFDRNPRTITKEQYEKLKEAIQKLGYHHPISAQPDGTIISGHQRAEALRDLGYETIRVSIPSRPLTDSEFKRMLVQANLNNGQWDFEALGELMPLDELGDLGMDDAALQKTAKANQDGLTDPDEVPVVPELPVSSLGDIWILGSHRVMCGDSTDALSMDILFGMANPDIVITDPPYGVNIVNVGTKKVVGAAPTKFKTASVGGGKIVDAKQYAPILGDETTDVAEKFYAACTMRGIKNYIIFGGNYFTDFLPPRACWVIWDKQNNGNFADVEMAWTSYPNGAKLYAHLWNGLARKGDHKTELATRVHPTQKPVGLFEQIFNDFQFKSCFDGFLGSGSTLIACEKTGRICYGMELSPAYCDVIIKRWQNFTGKQATHAVTGATFNSLKQEQAA